MKRVLFVLLAITVCLSVLTGCNAASADNDKASSSYEGEDTKYGQSEVSNIVSSQNETDKYTYSSIVVSSGEGNIRPIQCFLGSTQYENGEPTLSGCGDGVYRVFSDPETDPSDFPVLVFNRDITATVSANVTIGTVMIYDTNYNELKYRFDDLGELFELPAGEYLVVFSEHMDGSSGDPEIKDYWKTTYENLFKLCVNASAVGSTRTSAASTLIKRENGKYILTLPISENTVRVHDDQEYYFQHVTVEMLENAEKLLLEQMASYSENGAFYFEVDEGGKLYLCAELIVDIDPPNTQVYGDEVIASGCNVDHKHVFFNQCIE